MIADLNKIQLGSSFFAKIICREKSIGKLRDGTIYVLTGNKSEWNYAFVPQHYSIRRMTLSPTPRRCWISLKKMMRSGEEKVAH